jgi:enediyne polyketide synthase
MGQKLGVLDSLLRQGITPLPLDEALHSLKSMIGWKDAPVSSIVASRFGNLPTLQLPESELPLRRFLEHVQVYYPGIELIVDVELSAQSDPYLSDHVFQGEQLLPAVCGMEAMVQAAMALEDGAEVAELRQLRFEHPIVVPAGKPVMIRIAALRRQPGSVSVVIRCSSTSYLVDHFSGECVFTSRQAHEAGDQSQSARKPVALDPSRDLYGGILFHQGRFRRVEKYHLLQADRSVAELSLPVSSPWYARHLPAEFAAGNPASRDAALHSIQACIPHKTILPVGVDRIVLSTNWTTGRSTVHAFERVRDGNDFIYDLETRDEHGQIAEKWHGLHLHAVTPSRIERPLPLPLLVPYLERMLNELLSPELRLRLGEETAADAVQQMLGPEANITHRSDGKPEIVGCSGSHHVSVSHCCNLTFTVLAGHAVGCDLEKISAKSSEPWKSLLGESFPLAQLIAEKSRASLDVAATQVWSLKEALRKAGASLDQPLCLESVLPEHWITLSSGRFVATSFHTRVPEMDSDLAFAFVTEKKQ